MAFELCAIYYCIRLKVSKVFLLATNLILLGFCHEKFNKWQITLESSFFVKVFLLNECVGLYFGFQIASAYIISTVNGLNFDVAFYLHNN